MTVRFRIRTSGGQELSFASREMFEDFVRSGDLQPEDLVYDVDTGSWSPARTHPLVLDIEYESEASEPAAKSEGEAPDDEAFGLELAPEQPRAGDDDEDQGAAAPASEGKTDGQEGAFGLELAPAPEHSPDEAARAFVQKMEAEREQDFDFSPRDKSIQGFTMEDTSTLADIDSRPVAPSAPQPRRPTSPERPEPPKPEEPKAKAPRDRSTHTPVKGGGLLGKLIAGIVVIGLLGGGTYVGIRIASGTQGDDGSGPSAPGGTTRTPTPTPPVRQPDIPNTESAVRERALERYLASTENALRELPAVSEFWPTGEYLALPSEHAEILSQWQAYLSTIRRVRSADTDRYRTAYQAALDDALIEGDERTTRTAAAMSAFTQSAGVRNGHFDRVEGLASAAIQSHNALLQAEGLIIFDPAIGGGRNGLGAGAYGRDEASQELLDGVLDVLADRLDAGGLGPGRPENVRDWVLGGLLDVVTR